jgi:hypothetical protein
VCDEGSDDETEYKGKNYECEHLRDSFKMTAPVPASVETLAVQLAALDRRLTDALTARDREEKIRVDELAAWRGAHNGLLEMNTRISENMLTKAEYDQRHKSLETKIDTDLKFVNQRLTAMDEDRTAIKLSVTTLMARAGYISAGFVMGALGLLIALSNVLLDFIHPAVSVLSGVKP